MKSKLSIFILVLGLAFFSLLKVNAIVRVPPEPTIPLDSSTPSTGEGSSPGVIAPYQTPDEPVQIDPVGPASSPIIPIPNRVPTNKGPIPTPMPAPRNLNNYDIFGNNSGPDLRLPLICCLCICCPGLVLLFALAIIMYKNNKSYKVKS